MIRRLIPKIGSIRYINNADLKQSFDNRLKIKNKLALKDFYGENKKIAMFLYMIMKESSYVYWFLTTRVIISISI